MPRAALALLGLVVVLAAAGVPASSLATADSPAEVIARYPGDDGMTESVVITPDDVDAVDEPVQRDGRWHVPVTLTDAGGESFADTLVETGFTTDGVGACHTDGERNDEGYCLLTVVDGEVVSALGLAPSLADSIESGDFEDDPRFVLVTANESTAERAAEAFGQTVNGTGADSSTTDTGASTTGDDTDSSSASVPGVGAAGAVVAVLLGVVAAHYRR